MSHFQPVVKMHQAGQGVRAGDVVRLTKEWNGMPAGSIGVISGMRHCRLTSFAITFRASAFRDDDVVSCSGGPGALIESDEKLMPTGEEHLTWYWRWKRGRPGAGEGESYAMNALVWEWNGGNPE